MPEFYVWDGMHEKNKQGFGPIWKDKEKDLAKYAEDIREIILSSGKIKESTEK